MSADAMELREFIAGTLTQIVQGVRDAQQAVEDAGALINPVTGRKEVLTRADEARYGEGRNPIQTVTFDVALTLDKTDEKKGRIGVAKVLDIGVEGGVNTRNQSVNRVTFAVPILLPGHSAPTTGARWEVKIS